MEDTFRSIATRGSAEMKIRGSRFIGLANPAATQAEAIDVVEEARRSWHDARHHCFAFRLGPSGDTRRANDNGEPGGTAGPPILRQIETRGLTDTVVVVTRYFGGTRLGRGGLARAYAEAAGLALDAARVEEYEICRRFHVRFGYDDTAAAMHVIEAVGGSIVTSEYSDFTALLVDVRLSRTDAFKDLFANELAGRGEIAVHTTD